MAVRAVAEFGNLYSGSLKISLFVMAEEIVIFIEAQINVGILAAQPGPVLLIPHNNFGVLGEHLH